MATPNVGTTSWYYGELLDKDDAMLNSAQIATLTLTLYDKETMKIINSRSDSDLMPLTEANGTTVDNTRTIYNLELRLEPADNALVTGNRVDDDEEVHILLIEGTTVGTPSFTFSHKAEVSVKYVAPAIP